MTLGYEVNREFLEAGPDGRRILAEMDENRLVLVWRLPVPWLLFLLVLAAWWPIAPWWQSDDFIALHHSQHFGRALSDFFGNQYDLEGVVWFYRPLVTLSFAVEQLLAGGPSPLVSHLTNSVAHALTACLVGLLSARFLGSVPGFFAGLLWGLFPTHTTAVMWAVGRVDVLSGLFILLALVLGLRALDHERRTVGIGAVVAGALAFASKETALVLPGAMVLAAFAAARPRHRVRNVLATWPMFVLLGGYLLLRQAVLGRVFGGYAAGELDLAATVEGLGGKLLTLVDPLRLVRPDFFALPAWAVWAGLLPVVLALALVLRRRRFGLLAALALAFVGAAVPAVQFWALDGGLDLLRYLYLPAIPVAMLVAAGGVVPTLLAIAVLVPPSIQLHEDWNQQHERSQATHRRLLQAHRDLGGTEALFVDGLPRANEHGTTVAFDLGVDRLLRPPFTDDVGRTVRALRPLGQQTTVRRLPYGDDTGLPFDDVLTVGLADPTIVAALPPARISDLQVVYDGPEVLTADHVLALHERELTCRLVARGAREPYFRVTIFTAGGYLTVIVPDRGTGGDGIVDVRDVLHARYVTLDGADEYHVAFALEVPVAFDLEPAFPVLVEAGRLDERAGGFVATRANDEVVWLRFDRDYAEFIRGRPPR